MLVLVNANVHSVTPETDTLTEGHSPSPPLLDARVRKVYYSSEEQKGLESQASNLPLTTVPSLHQNPLATL